MIRIQHGSTQSPPVAAPRVGLLITAAGLLAVAALWNSLEPKALAPKLIGVVPFFLLLGFIALRAGPWLLALLVVGQTFFKGGLALLGGASRSNPVSLSLVAFGGVLGLLFLANISGRRGRLSLPVGLSRPAPLASLIAAAVLGLVLALRLPGSPLPDYGITKVLGYTVFNFVPMFVALVFLKKHGDVRQLVLAFAVVGTLSALVTQMYLWVTYGSIFGWGGLFRFDQINFFGLQVYGGVWLSRRAGFAALSAVALAYLAKTRRGVRFAIMVVAFNWFVIFLCGRGPFLAFTLSLLASLAMASLSGRLDHIRRSVSLLVPAMFVVGAITVGALALPTALENMYDISRWGAEQSRYRFNFYANAWEVFLANPVVGVGTGGWRAYYSGPDQLDINLYPHNILLELGAETGLAGLTPLLMMISIAFGAAVRLYRGASTGSQSQVWAVWALSLLLVSFLNAMLSGDIFRNDLLWVSAGIVGALRAVECRQESEVPKLRWAVVASRSN